MADNTRVLLASRPIGEPASDDFAIERIPVPEPADGEVVLRTIYLSLDPYMRGRMSAEKSYADPVEIGDVMVGGTVNEVLESRHADLATGDIVTGLTGWQSHPVVPGDELKRIDPAHAPISTRLGVLGMPGFTAYSGLLNIGRPQPGETVVVAAAAGPVGATVGQIAQIVGARVVGIAGGPEKVAWLHEIGFDAAVDHRSPDFIADLAAATPDGIDVYFENVGGAVWDAVFPRLNEFARIPVCGLVAHYNDTQPPEGPDRAPALMRAILTKSLTLRGFIQREFVSSHYREFLTDVGAWMSEGRLRYREDIVDGLENAPEAFIGLLHGANFGKLLVRVSPDPTD